jgi:hypothetical protein
MPATQVSPYLRRKLSDDARQLLQQALVESDCDEYSLLNVPLVQRLQCFRGKIVLEIPGASSSIPLRLTVTSKSYIIRYLVESIDLEVAVHNKAGSLTSWATKSDGRHVQLRNYIAARDTPDKICKQITTLIEVLEHVDLFDIFRGCQTAVPIPLSPSILHNHEVFSSTSEKNNYSFVCDAITGRPLSVTQTALAGSSSSLQKIMIIMEEYLRFDGVIDIPIGIKSDVELMIDVAMTCFSQWNFESQQLAMGIFDTIDKDEDGFITGSDALNQLIIAGNAEQHATKIVAEMTRLICDSNDPSEEIQFYKFCGFWITMLTEGYHVSDPANETQVLRAFQNLFLGQ